MVYNLVDRAFLLSDEKFHSNNHKFITHFLINNKYPIDFINVHINNRLKKLDYVQKNSHKSEPTVKKNDSSMPVVKISLSSEFKKISKLFANFNIRTVPTLKMLKFNYHSRER